MRSSGVVGSAATGSLWQAVTPHPEALPPLSGQRQADVVVIGAGFTGLAAALELRRRGADVVVLEAAQPGWGASGRNSGLVIPTLTRPDPDDIVARHGESGERFVHLLRDSADQLFALARSLGLGAEAERNGWLQPAHTPGRVALLERRVAQWRKWGAPVRMLDRNEVRQALGSDAWQAGLLNDSGGTVNPLALLHAMVAASRAAGITIHGHSAVTSFRRNGDRWLVATANGMITARGLLLATNAYSAEFTPQLAPQIAREIVPVVSWLAATEPLPERLRRDVIPRRVAMSDTRGDLRFARYDADHRLISGGALINPVDRPARLRTLVAARLARLWPQLDTTRIAFVWNGLIGITPDRFPRFHQLGPDAFAWAGCNGRAVALSLAVGREFARALSGERLGDLALPFTDPTPLPAHGVLRRLAPLALLNYRWRDAREI
ncbi:NAD(P)/FAD-dependent oxidoreductase [Bradyrhizobium prioriisuperbiae]|uniref:NAD(P)/FAD-dependent oxidoreductase n=1 Tax=Bradyrhizobium prioriisuperbiae TaxID=2854389 RepID=UPI003CCDBE82